ncbi:hypothetical protein D3C86_764450 [compost metagenome]
MWTEQIPFVTVLNSFHEQIGKADPVEHVMRSHTLIPVVQLQVEEGENVFMENVEVYSNGTLTRT